MADNTQYALEWSKSQNCFHVQKLQYALNAATANFYNDNDNDYKIIFVGEKDECHDVADDLRFVLLERAKPETQRPLL